ncbi:Initiation factor 2 subunit family [Popillia japonica]|uniref:Translation initiation factor eIF2B subunit beta n=1 Tax=Popillia japonica TaxID=7064 RepID=A0AAW1LS57_POPJA
MYEKDQMIDIIKLITDIKHGKLSSSYSIAVRAEQSLENLISQGKWNTAQELMNLIKLRLKKIVHLLPQEATTNNIMRHILKIIRDEYDAGFKSKAEGQQTLHHLVTADLDKDATDYSKPLPSLKLALLDHLAEYKVELEASGDNIASQASEHIHSNEVILTVGKSNTVKKFLKFAAKTRKYHVIVVESAPDYQGHAMAASLAKSNIQTIVIPDSAVFAMMSRVNKVIIGTYTVMANGGLRAASGVNSVALAAKHYSVPVMVLVHMYKLSPIHACAYEQDTFNVFASPGDVLPYSSGPVLNKVHIYNPIFDYVPPELVTLFITHQGGNAASYVYRLLSELYHPDDYYL